MRLFVVAVLVVVLWVAATGVLAQDPAPGWLAYAHAQCPNGTHLTHMEAEWKVGANPQQSDAFFSPWFGSDTTDNLCLIQPVNPWFGSSWSLYTEYYQWSNGYNQNSNQQPANAGDTLHGQLTYLGDTQNAYKLVQTDVTTGATSTQNIPVQQHSSGAYKQYTQLYFVYEKVANCNQYPPDGKVTFENIKVYCSGRQVWPEWTTSWVENVCNMRAHIVNKDTITITWDTQAPNPTSDQFERSNKSRHVLRPAFSKKH